MLKPGLGTRQELRVSPALLTLARMLELTNLDLHQAIREELAANPALEEIEHTLSATAYSAGDDQRLLQVAAPLSLADALLIDLRASLPTSEHALAELLIGSLDERGLLSETLQGIARLAGVKRSRIEDIVRVLRMIGPPGVGAANPRECLLVQLDTLAVGGNPHPLARAIVADHLDALGAGHYRVIARTLGMDVATITDAHTFIRTNLWPYPFQAALAAHSEANRPIYRVPDLRFRAAGPGFVAELVTSPGRALRLNPSYATLAENGSDLSRDEQEHVREYVERTHLFLVSLRRREDTLLQVGNAIAIRQAAFLHHGAHALVALTRQQIAADLEVHESTISRAVSDKIAQLPNRNLCVLDDFFMAAMPILEELRILVANEPHPLSDSVLASLLAERGYPIARRTVAKYRDQLGIPPHHQRAQRTV